MDANSVIPVYQNVLVTENACYVYQGIRNFMKYQRLSCLDEFL